MTDEQADATLRPTTPNPKLLVSKTWIQWAALVVLFGFFVLGLLAYRTYIAWMVFVALLPLGLLQLYESVNHGYYEARELSFLTNPTNRFLEWLRLPGDFVLQAADLDARPAQTSTATPDERVKLEKPTTKFVTTLDRDGPVITSFVRRPIPHLNRWC